MRDELITNDDIVSAVRRSEQALCEQITTWSAEPFGVAYSSEAFPRLVGANQLRDAWLGEMDAVAAFESVEAYYRERGLTCLRWVPASGQPVEPIEAHLIGLGWRRVETAALALVDWEAALRALPATSASNQSPAADASEVTDSFRILPARAMKRAYRKTFESEASPDLADAALERLNDANFDAFVCMSGDEPVGRAAYHEVGDIASLSDLFVRSPHRRGGAAAAMIACFSSMARRLSPRIAVAACEADNAEGLARLDASGFRVAGQLVAFDRPDR